MEFTPVYIKVHEINVMGGLFKKSDVEMQPRIESNSIKKYPMMVKPFGNILK
jgi:hypothetical protein